MDLTSLDLSEQLVLRALFELAQHDHPAQPDVLARVLNLDGAAVTAVLARLDARGLVDRTRARLTLPGLAAAANLPALPSAALAWLPASDDGARERSGVARVALRLVGNERGSHR